MSRSPNRTIIRLGDLLYGATWIVIVSVLSKNGKIFFITFCTCGFTEYIQIICFLFTFCINCNTIQTES